MRKRRNKSKDSLVENNDTLIEKALSNDQKGYDSSNSKPNEDATFTALFDQNTTSIDFDATMNFEKIGLERRKQIEKDVENSGLNNEEFQDEFGIIAPMPVSANQPTISMNRANQVITTMLETVQGNSVNDIYFAKEKTSEHTNNNTFDIELANTSINENSTVKPIETIHDILNEDEPISEEIDTSSLAQELEENNIFSFENETSNNITESKLELTAQFNAIFDNIGENSSSYQSIDDILGELSSIGKPNDGNNFDNTTDYVFSDILSQKEKEKIKEQPVTNQIINEEKEIHEIISEKPTKINNEPNLDISNETPQATIIKEIVSKTNDTSKQQEESTKTEPIVEETTSKVVLPQENNNVEKREFKQIDNFPTLENPYSYRNKVPTHIISLNTIRPSLNFLSRTIKNDAKVSFAPSKEIVSGLYDNNKPTAERKNDYKNPSDATTIRKKLTSNIKSSLSAVFFTGILTIVMFFISSTNEQTFTLSNTASDANLYLILNLSMVALATVICIIPFINGVIGLLKLKPNVDSSMSIAIIAVILQLAFSFGNDATILQGDTHVFGLVAVFAIFLNALGRLIMQRRIKSNFSFLTSPTQKYVVNLYGDYINSTELTKDCVVGTPILAYQRKTDFLKRFIQLSNESDPSELISQRLTGLFLVASAVLSIIKSLITLNFMDGLNLFAALSCTSLAIGNLICVNLPLSRLCSKVKKQGAMISSYYAASEMAKTNSVIVDSHDLFPNGSVLVNDVKFHSSRNAETAILYSAALASKLGGTIKDVFLSLVPKEDLIGINVNSFNIEDSNGISGIVNGEQIIVGNRNLLIKHGIQTPDRQAVIDYVSRGYKIFFIAINNQLTATIALEYRIDKRRKIQLANLEKNGISVIIRTTDMNITHKTICKTFALDESSVKILTGEQGEIYSKITRDSIPKADALIATKGKAESMFAVLSACAEQKKMVMLLVVMQCIGMVIGFSLSLILGFFGGFSQLSAISIFMYLLFWLLVIVLVPKIKKM